jgi:3'-phosphoadenosine 5'-phosphosulfate sulfotransferase (PAPS reductase)/FAD synthetase
MVPHSGGCHCGKVRIEVIAPHPLATALDGYDAWVSGVRRDAERG